MMFLLLILTAFGTPSWSQSAKAVTENRLQECYQNFPFFMDALMLISDEDFENPKMSSARKIIIQKEFEKKPTEIRTCLADILQFSKAQGDDENVKHVVKRFREISSVVYNAKSQAPIGSGSGAR